MHRAARSKIGTKPPAFRAVQLASLVVAVPSGNRWLHEITALWFRSEAVREGRSRHRSATPRAECRR